MSEKNTGCGCGCPGKQVQRGAETTPAAKKESEAKKAK